MDKHMFETRIRALWPGMVRTAFCIVRNHSDAEDAAAQAIANCWRALPRLRKEEAFDAWAMRACINEARMILRRSKRLELRDELPDTPSEEVQPDMLRPMLMLLPEKDRIALTLMYYEDYPLEQIAAVFGVSRGTAASRIWRARKKLKIILEQEGYLDE